MAQQSEALGIQHQSVGALCDELFECHVIRAPTLPHPRVELAQICLVAWVELQHRQLVLRVLLLLLLLRARGRGLEHLTPQGLPDPRGIALDPGLHEAAFENFEVDGLVDIHLEELPPCARHGVVCLRTLLPHLLHQLRRGGVVHRRSTHVPGLCRHMLPLHPLVVAQLGVSGLVANLTSLFVHFGRFLVDVLQPDLVVRVGVIVVNHSVDAVGDFDFLTECLEFIGADDACRIGIVLLECNLETGSFRGTSETLVAFNLELLDVIVDPGIQMFQPQAFLAVFPGKFGEVCEQSLILLLLLFIRPGRQDAGSLHTINEGMEVELLEVVHRQSPLPSPGDATELPAELRDEEPSHVLRLRLPAALPPGLPEAIILFGSHI
mmetsp:Transcript_1037/g.4265  ORF Transcript_1037/g.4265 Transcript_1037/m.4265 type:complete len:379 (+) Transcript_1037:1166-2302(+)